MNQPPDPLSLAERDELQQRSDAVVADCAGDSDGRIASGLRQGRACAWAELYDTYSVRVWQYVSRLIGSDAPAVGDVVQETLLAAAESARTFDDSKGSLYQWLTGIAHHRVARYWQAHQRRQTVLQHYHQQLEHHKHDSQQWFDSETAPDARMKQQESADLVRLVLAHLPAEYAALLTAKYIDELSVADIQKQTLSSSDAVRSKLMRARKEFRNVYQRIARDADEPPS